MANEKYLCLLSPENNVVVLDLSSLFPNDETTGHYIKIQLISEENRDYINKHVYIDSVPLGYWDDTINSNDPYGRHIIRLDVSDNEIKPCSFVLNITPTNGTNNGTIKVQVVDSDTYKSDIVNSESKILSGPLESFMLLRTNPKLTGNIKLVVDSDYDLYLDTFKVSNVLNDRIYRKHPVSAEGNYARDVMQVFSKLPQGELFKLPADSLNPHKFYNDFKYQYRTEYEYGAITNMDNMYPENMKILAPIHIGKTIPDFFCIFRYSGTHNEETYKNNSINDKEKMIELLKSSEVVKTFDLRTYTSIGQYLNNYRNSINDFLYGSCYMQFIEQDNEKYGTNYRQGNNSWRGIDVARGIITNKVETSYYANETLNEESGVQESFDRFILNGYERNNILYPYILNLEFMFNDDDVKEYEMNRYFGIYLSANDFIKYDCIVNDNNGLRLKLNANNEIVHDEYTFSKIFTDTFSDRLFYMITNDFADRVKSTDDVDNFISKYVLNHPDKNMITANTEPAEFEDDMISFITLTFTEPIQYGEHIRFIALSVYNSIKQEDENICLEIIASNDERLRDCDNYISSYVSTNNPEIHKCTTGERKNNNIYRLAFYTQDLTDESKSATIAEQIERIIACIDKFSSFVKVSSHSDKTIGIVSEYDEVYCQHISVPNQEESIEFQVLYYGKTDDGSLKLCVENVYEEDAVVNNTYYADECILSDATDVVLNDNITFIGEDVHINGNIEGIGECDIEDGKCAILTADYKNKNNQKKDNIRYFNTIDDTNMFPISPDSYYYSNRFICFGLYGFDMLGWRYQNIVKFKKVSDLKYAYASFDDIETIIKNIKHPLVKMKNNLYDVIHDITIEHGYVSMNTMLMCGYQTHTQKLYTDEHVRKCLICPYNVNGYIISFDRELYLDDYRMNIYKPESASCAVMGMLPIKDMDVNVNIERLEIKTEQTAIIIKSGEMLKLDSKSDQRLRSNVLYEIEYGKFTEFSAHRFIISDNILYYIQTNDTHISFRSIYNGALTVSVDMKLKVVDSNEYQKFIYEYKIPVHNIDNFYVNNMTDEYTRKLKISVVPQTNCLWKSNGMYFDGNSVLDVDKLKDYDIQGQFNEHVYTPNSATAAYGYLENIPSSYTNIDGKLYSYDEVIQKSLIDNPMRKMLIQNSNIDTAIGYYNPYVQSLEFIYYGIKFTMKFNNEYHNQSLRIGEYNNFEVVIINEFDNTKENEIYISVDEEIILFVNHKFNMYSSSKTTSQIKNIENLNEYVPYNYYKANYKILSNSITSDQKDGEDSFITMIADNNINIGENDVFYLHEESVLMSNVISEYMQPFYFVYEYTDKCKVDKDIIHVESTKSNILSYDSGDSGFLYSINYFSDYSNVMFNSTGRKANSFVVSKTVEPREVSNENSADKLKKYMESFTNVYKCYIINNKSCETVMINESYMPLSVQLSMPNKIKYNYGYFIPYTNDIIKYETNDYELTDILSMSMLLGNTKVSDVNRLMTYTGNKVYSTTQGNIKENFFIKNNKSIFESNWDNQFYRSYKNDVVFTNLYGYYPGVEDKSFFGSRCLCIKSDYITLDNFKSSSSNQNKVITVVDSDYNKFASNNKQYKIMINITQSIYTLFMNDETFVSNWSDTFTDVETSIKNYIASTISQIYNMQRKIEVVMYKKSVNDAEDMQVVLSEPDDFNKSDWSVHDNFKTEFSTKNDEMILTIWMSELNYTKVHPQIKIYRC